MLQHFGPRYQEEVDEVRAWMETGWKIKMWGGKFLLRVDGWRDDVVSFCLDHILAIFSVGGSQLDFTLEAVPDLSCKHFPAATHVLFVVTVATGEMNRNDDIWTVISTHGIYG